MVAPPIAQSVVENIPLLSADKIFDAYPIRRVWEAASLFYQKINKQSAPKKLNITLGSARQR